MFNAKDCSSAPQTLQLACFIGISSKIRFALFLNSYHVVLLRHYMLMRKLVVPRKSGRLGGGIRYLILSFVEMTGIVVTCLAPTDKLHCSILQERLRLKKTY
jgi:hypothetical protein